MVAVLIAVLVVSAAAANPCCSVGCSKCGDGGGGGGGGGGARWYVCFELVVCLQQLQKGGCSSWKRRDWDFQFLFDDRPP